MVLKKFILNSRTKSILLMTHFHLSNSLRPELCLVFNNFTIIIQVNEILPSIFSRQKSCWKSWISKRCLFHFKRTQWYARTGLALRNLNSWIFFPQWTLCPAHTQCKRKFIIHLEWSNVTSFTKKRTNATSDFSAQNFFYAIHEWQFVYIYIHMF